MPYSYRVSEPYAPSMTCHLIGCPVINAVQVNAGLSWKAKIHKQCLYDALQFSSDTYSVRIWRNNHPKASLTASFLSPPTSVNASFHRGISVVSWKHSLPERINCWRCWHYHFTGTLAVATWTVHSQFSVSLQCKHAWKVGHYLLNVSFSSELILRFMRRLVLLLSLCHYSSTVKLGSPYHKKT